MRGDGITTVISQRLGDRQLREGEPVEAGASAAEGA
jgi:hypothetical protein